MYKPISDRDKAILEMRESGATFRAIGAEFHLSGERVRQIIKKAKHKIAWDYVLSLYQDGLSYEDIAFEVRKKFDFKTAFYSEAGVHQALECWKRHNAYKYNCKVRVACSSCEHGSVVSSENCVFCEHPKREAATPFYGKYRPHDCPLRM